MIGDTINMHVQEVCFKFHIDISELRGGPISPAVSAAYQQITTKGRLFAPAMLGKYVGISRSRCSTLSASIYNLKYTEHANKQKRLSS